MRLILAILICVNILFANEEETKTVKTSELELFLFKIGFQSLLKDVDINKNRSSLNEQELAKLNSKIEIIMNEIYKDKRVITTETNISNSTQNINTNSSKDIEFLRQEIEALKKQVQALQNSKKTEPLKVQKPKTKEFKALVKIDKANLRDRPLPSGNIIEILDKNSELEIEKCNSYSWCKVKGEEKYIARYLLTRL